MKLSLVLFLLFDLPRIKGQEEIEATEQICLRFFFHSDYNFYRKYCCKLYPDRCFKLMDSAGYIYHYVKDRVSTQHGNGWIQFNIVDVQLWDEGTYRCVVEGTNIYKDYIVKVPEQIHRPLTTTIKAPDTCETSMLTTTMLSTAGSTRAVVGNEQADTPRIPQSFNLPLVVIVSISVMVFVMFLIAVVSCRVKAKRKQSSETPVGSGETARQSSKQEVPEESGVVYSVVEFLPRYGDPGTQSATAEDDTMVEYSALAIK